MLAHTKNNQVEYDMTNSSSDINTSSLCKRIMLIISGRVKRCSVTVFFETLCRGKLILYEKKCIYFCLCGSSQKTVQVEYDLANSSNDTLSLKSIHRIEQTALPLSLEFYPCDAVSSNEIFLLTSNDQHKLKLYNSTTKMCRYTFLAPTFDSPIYS